MKKALLFLYFTVISIQSETFKYIQDLEQEAYNINLKISQICCKLNQKHFDRQEWHLVDDMSEQDEKVISDISAYINNANQQDLDKLKIQLDQCKKCLTKTMESISPLIGFNRKAYEQTLKLNFEKFDMQPNQVYEKLNLDLDNRTVSQVNLYEIKGAIVILENQSLARQMDYIFRNEVQRFLYDAWLENKDISNEIQNLVPEYAKILGYLLNLAEIELQIQMRLKKLN